MGDYISPYNVEYDFELGLPVDENGNPVDISSDEMDCKYRTLDGLKCLSEENPSEYCGLRNPWICDYC